MKNPQENDRRRGASHFYDLSLGFGLRLVFEPAGTNGQPPAIPRALWKWRMYLTSGKGT